MTAEEILRLVAAGVQAPSADNRHVVRFTARRSSLIVHVSLDELGFPPAHRVAFHELAFGAVIENVLLTAPGLGYTASATVNKDWRANGIVAVIEFTRGVQAHFNSLSTAIFARTTNRRLYGRKRIPDEVSSALGASVNEVDGARIRWLREPVLRRRALALIWRTESERFRNRRLHAELYEAVRFDVGWSAAAAIGIPPGALEVEMASQPLFHALRRWPLQRALNHLGAAMVLGARAAWLPARTASHLAILTMAATSNADYVAGGRALQRFWLAATVYGVAVQPMAASVALALLDPAAKWASPSAITRAKEELDRLGEQRLPVMLIRVGYADQPSVRAGRDDAKRFLVELGSST